MWISRNDKKSSFINILNSLKGQVLIVRGARQVGKTSFVLNILDGLKEYPQVSINCLYATSRKILGRNYLGRDFLGASPDGTDLLKNLEQLFSQTPNNHKPVLVFIDEVDRHPKILEAIQLLAEFSPDIKFILTGSNLENITVKNAATGRKHFFDLYPISFLDFLNASGSEQEKAYLHSLTFGGNQQTDFFHNKLMELVKTYVRLGGMPTIIAAYLEERLKEIPEIVKDLTFSIEENVKAVLGEKSKLYEYEDVLRKLAILSLNTLKYTNLQVQHAGQAEAKRLVNKTVGARVAHKIRLLRTERDLSKYILFDSGIANYLLNGSDLLNYRIHPEHLAIMLETFVGNEIISQLVTRDDLFYWKSGNRAGLEFVVRSPKFSGIDVKSSTGKNFSLMSFAILETQADLLIKVGATKMFYHSDYQASLPNDPRKRQISFLQIPHYLVCRLIEFLQ
ncbi:MAG: ATP-binding protein [Deltaproteobacteria bacterium]|nr:ATP-binding protein [Deltaproteobacteria bacterium]